MLLRLEAYCGSFMTKSKFYAVRKGLAPGIYRSWDDCKLQTQGVSGAIFQSFKTREAAEQYLESDVGTVSLNTSAQRAPAKRKTRVSPARKASAEAAAAPSRKGHDAAELQECTEQKPFAARSDTEALPSWMDPEMTYRLEFDGASRGNPGRAGAGAALFEDESGKQVGSICLKLGHMTNNQAEYYGLLAGLEAARAVGVQHLKVLGDSQLVIRQVNGRYKVTNNALKSLYSRVKLVLEAFQHSQVKHVLREHNKVADELSNRAIDTDGWQGLKDLQGRLWGTCRVDSDARQSAVMVQPLSGAQWIYSQAHCGHVLLLSSFPRGSHIAVHSHRSALPLPVMHTQKRMTGFLQPSFLPSTARSLLRVRYVTQHLTRSKKSAMQQCASTMMQLC